MTGVRFDFDQLFDRDYRYFYEVLVPEPRTAEEADLVCELLRLAPDARLLDIGCGYGRMACALAARGLRVTGIDTSRPLLQDARSAARERRQAVDLVQADMRALPWYSTFDAVLCWFTTFGYFDDPTLRAVLAEMRSTLKPGARLLLETLNRDGMLLEFQDTSVVERGDDLMVDQNRFDVLTGRSHHQRTLVRDGRTRHAEFSVRHFTFPELRDWLRTAGFGHVAAYGSEGEEFSIDSERMIVVATAD